MEYELSVGLEVHAELNTKTKIFCGCENRFGAPPNTLVCPVCMGLPGALPVLSEAVLAQAVRMGHALHCDINRVCRLDRKQYFYPDLPKAYQISQNEIPLCSEGFLELSGDREPVRIRIERIHIEEDAGKLIHSESFSGSLVDLNRCGVPLIEIVSEPDMRSAHEAKAYLDSIRAILQYLDISDCKMQEGSIRCDVNVSVMPEGAAQFGTRCEMKNVNGFSAVERAIEYEARRQMEILEAGGTISQETRRWDDLAGKNYLLRSKEDAQDYRYFPEPDLGAIVVPEELLEALRATIPELPGAKLLRYMKETGLPFFDANLLCENPDKADYFEKCLALGLCQPKAVSNWLLGDVSRILNEKNKAIADTRLTPEKLCQMIALIEKKTISNTAGKTVLEEIIWSDKTPGDVVKEKGLAQISDTSALEAIVQSVIDANQKVVADFHGGKTNALGFLVGQCMRQSKGQGNPAIIRELLEKALG